MATGIVSTGVDSLGPAWLSRLLFAAAACGLVLLGIALVARLARHPSRIAADAKAAERVFGFFTLVAGINVLGVRFNLAGHPVVTAVLAGIAGLAWLFLTYAIPAGLLLSRQSDSVLGGINGTWLLWVVATQSVSISASVLVHTWPSQRGLLAPTAVTLWGIGLVIYLVLVTLIFLRWLTIPMKAGVLGPPYWILMGATAISVLAGGRFLALPSALPVRQVLSGTVAGFSFVLWSFGTWWVPMLVILGLWRHLRQRWPLSYETSLWSMVFPLGMYAVATLTFGKVEHLTFMAPISRVAIWTAVFAWTAVAAGMAAAAARYLTATGKPEAPALPAKAK